jgi:biopolymer transport protein ExbD
MQAGQSDETAITGINVTPLVDIILVVLIIFMATAPMISQRAMKVDVPKAAHHERSATDALPLVFNAQRQLLLGGKLVALDELAKHLAGAVSVQADLRVSLSADKTLPYGEVVAVLDAVRGAGVRKVGLQVVNR